MKLSIDHPEKKMAEMMKWTISVMKREDRQTSVPPMIDRPVCHTYFSILLAGRVSSMIRPCFLRRLCAQHPAKMHIMML